VDANKVWGSFGAWGTNEGVISVSRDGAKTWTVVGHPGNGLPMARHPQVFVADGRVLATADEHGVYASEDEGQSWHESNGGLPGREVRRLARVNAHSFVAVANGQHPSLYRSDDAGRNWRKIGELPTLDARDVIAADAQGNRLYVAGRRLYRGKLHPGGVFASSDGGVTWKQVLDDRFAECLAIDPRDPSVVFAGLHDHPYHDRSIGGGLRMSRDGGVTWTDLTSSTLHNHSVSCITVDAAGGKLYVGTAGNGVFVTPLP
jgi:photosystem II stability/assembly factor-like uncharacterized protein